MRGRSSRGPAPRASGPMEGLLPPETTRLRDGSTVTVRPIRDADAPRLAAFHRGLSDETVHFRYGGGFGLSGRTAPSRLADRCHAHAGEVVLVAEAEGAPPSTLLAVARLVPVPDEPGTAEFAIVVRDDRQGLGLGTALLRRLFEAGRRAGVARVVGVVLPENARMLRLCQRLGAKTRAVPEDGIVLATVGA